MKEKERRIIRRELTDGIAECESIPCRARRVTVCSVDSKWLGDRLKSRYVIRR